MLKVNNIEFGVVVVIVADAYANHFFFGGEGGSDVLGCAFSIYHTCIKIRKKYQIF